MPPPADRKLGRLANFDTFPLAHEFQNDCGESLTALRANQQAMGARTRQRRRDGNYRIHRVRTCTLATSLAVGDYGMLLNRDQRRSATAIGGRSVDNSGENGVEGKAGYPPVTGNDGEHLREAGM
jgi:hypothetical protein